MLWETELPALQGTSLHCFASTSTEKNHRRSATVEPKGVRGALVVFHCKGGHCSNCSELHRSCRNVLYSALHCSEAHVLQHGSMWSILIIGPVGNAVLGIIIWKAAYFSLKVWIVYCIRVQWTMRRMYGSEAHGLHRLITQRVFIVSLTVYKMNSDDKANGNDNRSVSSWQFRKWITMTNNLCQFAFVIIRAICKIDVVDQIDQILVNVCCIDLRCYFV